MNTIKRFWALCLDTHMKLALYKYAIIIIIIIIISKSMLSLADLPLSSKYVNEAYTFWSMHRCLIVTQIRV